MHKLSSIHAKRRLRAFTLVEMLVGTAIVMLLAISATSLLTIITRRVNNDHTRYTLATSNARTAHIISELARRSTRVWVYASLANAAAGTTPAPAGDVIAFQLADGTRRFIAFEDTSINFYADPSQSPLTLAGGSPGMIADRIGTDAHCSFTQGLPRVGWLAEAQTTQGWTEQITYSAFAVALHNR